MSAEGVTGAGIRLVLDQVHPALCLAQVRIQTYLVLLIVASKSPQGLRNLIFDRVEQIMFPSSLEIYDNGK